MVTRRKRLIPAPLAAGMLALLVIGYFGIVAAIGANIQSPELGQAGVGLVIALLGLGYLAMGPSYENVTTFGLSVLGIFALLLGGLLVISVIAGVLMPHQGSTGIWAMALLAIAVPLGSTEIVRAYKQAGVGWRYIFLPPH